MTIHEMVKTYGTGQGEDAMWKSVCAISKYVDAHKDEDPDAYAELERTLYGIMNGQHYNEEYGREQIDRMWYVDQRGNKHIAPYWTDDEMKAVWEKVKGVVPDAYSEWDFYVTMNMMQSDYGNTLKEWWPSATEGELTEKVTDMAIAWLNDPDTEKEGCKVWCYFA